VLAELVDEDDVLDEELCELWLITVWQL